jgi:hypothetical protein
MSTKTATINRATAITVMQALGFKTAAKWGKERLTNAINKIELDPSAQINEGIKPAVDKILAALQDGGKITITAKKDEDAPPVKAAPVKAKGVAGIARAKAAKAKAAKATPDAKKVTRAKVAKTIVDKEKAAEKAAKAKKAEAAKAAPVAEKAPAKAKAAPTPKEAPAAPKAAPVDATMDYAGSRLGTKVSAFNLAITEDPKTHRELKMISGRSDHMYYHLDRLIFLGLVAKTEDNKYYRI